MLDDRAGVIAGVCRRGLDPDVLRDEVLRRLRRAVPVDAVWWALADPATLLFTRTYREEIPERSAPYFVENEFLSDDFNKWTEVAAEPSGTRTLSGATAGRLASSARYRDIFEPLGLGDELRVAFRSGDACWGFACLHRERGTPFSAEEVRFVGSIARHVAEGIRTGLVLEQADAAPLHRAPGVILLRDGVPTAATPAGEAWLEELSLPEELLSLFMRVDETAVPPLCVRTRAGRWAILHTSSLEGATAIVVEEASAPEVASVIMLAYGLTERERTITGLVCRGLSTAAIAAALRISEYTVQDHLKSIFQKVGVRSRRELVATILREHYL